jgi:hypothetical protein
VYKHGAELEDQEGKYKEGGYGSIWQTLKVMDWLLTKLEAEKD